MTATDGEPRPATATARAVPADEIRWEDTPAAPTLAARMDEAALAVHPVTPLRMVLCAFGGLAAAMILPWRAAAAWVAVGLALEVWSWFASRAQARGDLVGRRARANFVANYLAINLLWLVLGVMFLRAGTPEGQASAAVLFLAMGAIALLLFHNVPLVFLAAGAAPPIAALIVITLRDGRDWRQMLPIWVMLGLSVIFNLGRALGSPSVQASNRRLAASLNQYRILTENITDMIVRTDLVGTHQYISAASLAVLGYRPDELMGLSRPAYVHPDSEAALGAGVSRMMADPATSQVLMLRMRHKDGRWIWVQTNAKIVCEGGVPVGVIGVSRDVTQAMNDAAALQVAKAEAESATRAKAEFLANVSHEIRTPMNGVLGALHLLERETISPEGRELMRQAGDCGRMLSQLLNDVLDFSKIEAGQLDLAPEPMHVGEALEAVTALLAGQARAKGVELRCEISSESGGQDDLWIEADPVRLRQAMFNLVGNAVKFTAKGHVIARLTVAPAPDARRHLRLEVEDTGIGMTALAQSHLFERFRQAESDTARRFGGTGLGLSITQALAHMMGGEIAFTSVDGQGSTFWLEFDAPAAAAVGALAVEEGLLDGLSILLVEDNATNRLVARTLLGRLGAAVTEAEDGVAGLAAARAGAFDLILMDVQMPHMNGVEATRAIRGLPAAAAQAPIIGLTANVMVHQRAEYLAAGMNGVVAKPISPTALLEEIARVMAPPADALAG